MAALTRPSHRRRRLATLPPRPSWRWPHRSPPPPAPALLRFETTGRFDVTLTVTDDQNQTGSVTQVMVVEISG